MTETIKKVGTIAVVRYDTEPEKTGVLEVFSLWINGDNHMKNNDNYRLTSVRKLDGWSLSLAIVGFLCLCYCLYLIYNNSESVFIVIPSLIALFLGVKNITKMEVVCYPEQTHTKDEHEL